MTATTAVRIQAATVPGTDVVIEVVQTGDADFPFRTTRTANDRLRIRSVDTGFANEMWARESAKALWNEVVRNRNAAASHSTVGRNQGAAFAAVTATEIRRPSQVFAETGARKNTFGGSEPQQKFLVSLLEDLSKLDGLGDNGQVRFDKAVEAGLLKNRSDTSAAIDLALGAVKTLKATVVTSAPEVEDGATYRAPSGEVFHAYMSQSGRMLLKLWAPNGEVDEDGRELGEFAYFGAATRLPKGSVQMSTEDAQVFGRATGTCCICMRHLENDESVARGIGPVCWGKL